MFKSNIIAKKLYTFHINKQKQKTVDYSWLSVLHKSPSVHATLWWGARGAGCSISMLTQPGKDHPLCNVSILPYKYDWLRLFKLLNQKIIERMTFNKTPVAILREKKN